MSINMQLKDCEIMNKPYFSNGIHGFPEIRYEEIHFSCLQECKDKGKKV